MVQELDCWAWMYIPNLTSWVRGWCRGKREKEQEQQQQQHQRSWCSLPADILGEISSHLYAGDYNTFCAVCKAWRSAAVIKTTPTVDLLGKLFSEEESGSTPLLLQPPASGTMCTIFHPIRNAIYGIQIPELSGAHVHFSDHGWLLLTQDVDFSAFFLNPFTGQRIELPKPPRRYLFMSFFEPPTSPECVVVGLGDVIFGDTLKFGQGRQDWTNIVFDGEEDYEFMPFMSAPISYKGLIYFLCGEGVMILDVNNLSEEGNNIVDILESPFSKEEFSKMSHDWWEGFIVMDKGEIMVVYALQHWKKFQIFKWDDMKEDWQRMDSLPPNKMLFVSSQGMSLLESSAIKGTGNKIFIPMLHQGNTVFYSIRTGKYHSFYYTGSGSSSSSSPADDDTFNCGFTRQLHGIWIKPSLGKDKSSALMFKDDFSECPPLSTRPVLSFSSCSPPPAVSNSRPPHPWLICYGGEDMPNPILYSIQSGTTRIIPMEMQSKYICTSSYGCLVVKEEGATAASNNVQYFVLDVASGQRIQLPSLMDFRWNACLLSASLSDSNCHVIFIDLREECMMFCKLGDDGFVKVDYTGIVAGFFPFMAIGRKIYGYNLEGEVISRYLCFLEILERSTVRLMVKAQMPKRIFPACNSRLDYLIESAGEIFLVFALGPNHFSFEGPAMIDFAIYKLDLDLISNGSSRLEFSKVEDIGAQAIFLHICDRYGTFCSASEPTIKENSIYYLDNHNSMIYVWDLKLRNVTMHYPCAGVDGDCTVSWVMMQEASSYAANKMLCSPVTACPQLQEEELRTEQ